MILTWYIESEFAICCCGDNLLNLSVWNFDVRESHLLLFLPRWVSNTTRTTPLNWFRDLILSTIINLSNLDKVTFTAIRYMAKFGPLKGINRFKFFLKSLLITVIRVSSTSVPLGNFCSSVEESMRVVNMLYEKSYFS